MMKLFLLGLCLGLALAIPSSNNYDNKFNSRIEETSYRHGKEYVYEYDSQVMTGLTHTSTVQAGFRLRCLARVQFTTFSKVRVAFEKIMLYRVNEPVLQWKASERLMPEEFLKELVGDEAITMDQFLQIPFGFEYDNGQVLRIVLEDQETTWSANIKRGFASLFEMNLEKRFLMDESFPALKAENPPHTNLYNVLERSTTGDCVTLYTVTPNNEDDHQYVTKVRDYERCLNRPVYLNTIWNGYWTQDARKDNPLSNGATFKYSVRGNNKKFLILSAVGEGQIVFTPYKNQEQVRTSLNQTLSLKESKFIGREVSEIREINQGKHKRDNLRMTLPSQPIDCKDPFMPCNEEPKQISQQADVYTVEKIYLHLKMAARNTQDITSEESLQHLRVFKDMLKTSPEAILKKLWEKVYMSKVNPKADVDRLSRQIYWNVLPNVGTEASANVVLDICSTDFLMTNNCTMAIRNLALKTTPTMEIINKLIKLTSIGRLTSEVKQAAYLTLGTFGYKLTQHLKSQTEHCQRSQMMFNGLMKESNKDRSDYVENEKKRLNDRCNTMASRYIQGEETILRTLKKLSESSKQEDKILALKAIGNSGLPGSLPILKRYIDNRAEANILRVTAILGHRRIYYPETARLQAIKTLLKVYLTTTETSEIRSFAFLMMSSLRPQLSIYETVAMSLHHEKDIQLSGFVYSFFTAYSNSTYRPDWPMKTDMTTALKFSPEIRTGFDQAFMKRFSQFSEEYKRGNAWSVATIGDMSRYLGAAFSWETYNYGLVSEMFEIGVNTEGLNPFLNKLFGPKGLLTANKSLFDLLKRGPRDISPQERIHEIFRTLNIKTRSMPIPYGHIYYKVMGHEQGYLDFSHLMRTISTTGSYPMTWDEEGLRLGLPVAINTMYDMSDYLLTLPTESGFPVSLNIKIMSTVNIEGSLTFKVTPYTLDTDRQGQPPVAVHTKIDLKPKMVAELQCSMGLDTFYLKPVAGYRGLIKYNAPIQKEVKLDLTYRRLNLKCINNDMEKPAVELLVEPFSEFLMITKKNESPVFISERRNIWSPTGTRVMPISHNYKLNTLGYQLSITGQLPYCLSKTNPIRPFNGRSLINVFWRPMANAPSTITLMAQDIRPIREAVANSYAQTYQDVLTTRPEEYGRDFTRMEDSGVMKFDKFGRPLPQSPEEILPYSDPVDIEQRPINMQQMCNKFQHIFGKPMPFYNQEFSHGLVFLLDASTSTIKRQVQLETVWNYFNNGQMGRMFTRFWRSAIPEYDSQEWQMLSEMGVTYPFEVKEPKDIFDPKWQRELMKDLEHIISMESHKVVNQGINMTLLSLLQQFDYPSMVRVPTHRVLESLVPEQLYRLMNMTGNTIYNRRWDSYWHYLVPVYRQVKEDVRVAVDPHFVNRDLPLTDQLNQILKVQKFFLRDLRDIISKTVIAHAETPIVQWIDSIQAKTVYMIREIFNKAVMNDRLHEPAEIRTLLNRAESNVDTIISLVKQMMDKVTSVSQELDHEGKPVVVFKPEVLREVSRQANLLYKFDDAQGYEYEPRSFYTTEDKESRRQREEESLYSLRMSLYNLSLTQISFIEKVQMAISNKKDFDFDAWMDLLTEIRDNLNVLDNVLKTKPIVDPVVKQSLLLVTVQNEFGIDLLEQWRKFIGEDLHLKINVDTMEIFSFNSMLMKEHQVFLGERVSMFYHQDLMQRVVLPNLDSNEYPIYSEINGLNHRMIPEHREFMRMVTYNMTNMKQPEVLFAHCNKFCEQLTRHTDKIAEIEKALLELGQTPKLYLMSELLDSLHFLKHSTEFASRSLYTVKDQRRFTYLEKLSVVATRVQTLISALAPVFTKYERTSDLDIKQESVLNWMPIDTRVLDVQDVLVQQKMMKQQIRRFIQNPEVSDEVLSKVLTTFVDRCETLQETLKQNQVQVQAAVEQRKLFERQAVSAVWTKALNEQHNLYEIVLNIYNNNRDRLSDVVRISDRINALEMEIAQMDESHQDTLDDVKTRDSEYDNSYDIYRDTYMTQPLKDDYSQKTQKLLQPLTPFQYLPTGVTALMNITWGNEHILNKNAKIQFTASRSIEQIMYLFRQMSSVLRSQDFVTAINSRLADEPWLTNSVMQRLNTFNHLHFIAQAEKEQLPQWLLTKLAYVKDYFKATFWNEFQRQQPSKHVAKDQIQAMVDISDTNKQWDLYTVDKEETNIYQGLELSRWARTFPFFQNYQPMMDKVRSHLTFNHKPTQCMVNKDKVFTFDNVNYQLPYQMSKKEAVLAADCSEEKSFVITMVKSNTTFDGHVVRIMTEDRIVEVIPSYLSIEVRVNGKVIVLDENKPVVFSKKLHYDLYEPALRIVRKGFRVEVSYPLTGLHFIMEGTFLQIKISELYKRRMCGMCSNFDSQVSWEFEGPSREIYSSPRLFAQSYILREEDRHTYGPQNPEFIIQHDRYNDIVSHYRPRGGSGKYTTKNVPDQVMCKPVDATDVKQRKRGNLIQTCFSEKPVKKCPIVCPVAVKKERSKTALICLDIKDTRVPQLTRSASYGPVHDLPTVQVKRIVRRVPHAIKCQPEDIES